MFCTSSVVFFLFQTVKMRLYLLGAVFLYLALACNANPIILKAEDDKAEVQLKGEIQEETQGVFKGETTNVQADSTNIEDKKEEAETEEAPATTELEEVGETTTAPVKKVKTGE